MGTADEILGPPVFLAGHGGLVGSAIDRKLRAIGVEPLRRSRRDLDLLNQAAVSQFMQDERVETVILAAAKVGGIHANSSYPAEFIYENLQMQCNVIHEAYRAGVRRLLFLGSSCIYPKFATQPILEEALLTSALEKTNEPYAIAKIAGLKMCESYHSQFGVDFRSIMPTNLYGPGDNFHPLNSHVLPGLIRRFADAVEQGDDQIVIWGSGNPLREFMHVDDLADAIVHLLGVARGEWDEVTGWGVSHVNCGTGSDISIANLAHMIAEVTGFSGTIVYDSSKPDGTPRKLLDISRLENLGWKASIPLRDGVEQTYHWYLANKQSLRMA